MIDKHQEKFEKLYELYTEYNSHTNISSIRDRDEVYQKHFEDSLACLNHTRGVNKLIDIGTGGGFPALPLAITCPEIKITAVDSVAKKTKFLDLAKEELGLTNLKTITARAEELAHDPDHRDQYDLVVSRAVAELNTLLEYCIPFVKVGAKFIAYKKLDIDDELAKAESAAQKLNSKLVEKIKYRDKQLIIFEKTAATPNNYPREPGKAKKNPL